MLGSRTTRIAASAALAVALSLGGYAAAGAHSHGPNYQPPNIDIVKGQIQTYYGDQSGSVNGHSEFHGSALHVASPDSTYAHQMYKIERHARHRLPHLIRKADAEPVVLLDVDDTTLLTYSYEVWSGFRYVPSENADWIETIGMDPTFGMPALVNWAHRHGAEIYYLTGRPVSQLDPTIRDLKDAGYPEVESSHLYLRDRNTPPAYLDSCAPDCTTIQYKSLTRKHIESLGNDIVMNVGDQFSDLEGGYADKTVKLPNPMYFLP